MIGKSGANVESLTIGNEIPDAIAESMEEESVENEFIVETAGRRF